MSLLVRKISIGKWQEKEFFEHDQFAGDAITGCLRTSKNVLCAWRIESERDIDKAVLAFTSKCNKLEHLWFVLLDEQRLLENSIDVEQQDENIPFKEQIKCHVVLQRINYDKLGIIARSVFEEIKGERARLYIKGRLKKMLNDAISCGSICAEDLDPKLQNELK